MLTPKQKQIFEYIKKYIKENDYSPSLEEIGRHFKLVKSTVHQHVENLKTKGYLDKLKNQPRSIEISKKPKSEGLVKIPVLGTIAAGQPIEAIEDKEMIKVPKSQLSRSGEHYALRVRGNSMINEGIFDGDTVIIRKQPDAENGETVVALINEDEVTLKKIYKERNRFRLQPANPKLEPIYTKELVIQGKVISIIRNFNSKISIKKINYKSLINDLIKKYSIQEIEAALVSFYLKRNNIILKNNDFLKDMILKSQKKREVIDLYLEKIKTIDIKIVEKFFELLIPKKDRKLNGEFYTPNFIVEYILAKTIASKTRMVCDCSCGSGAFLVSATKKLSKLTGRNIIKIIENNIYGGDILDYSVRRTKILLSLLALKHGEDKQKIKYNLVVADSLNFNWEKRFPEVFNKGGFDAVIGNPPYVKIQDLRSGVKEALMKKWETISKGNFNLYIPFFELGVKLLNSKGKLGYIVPNNYFTSLAAEDLRRYFQKNKLIEEILDFNHLRVFKDVLTYTCITILNKSEKSKFNYKLVESKRELDKFKNIKPVKIDFSVLNSKKWRLLNKKDFLNIKNIENIGEPLGKLAKIRVGIATLDDKSYFIDSSKSKGNYYIKNYRNKEFLIEKSITRKVVKISTVNNEQEIQENKRRIIFPYKLMNQGTLINNLKLEQKVKLVTEKRLKEEYPECYKYLLFIKDELKKRDKGKKSYPVWYAYGRSQSLSNFGPKLLIRTFNKKPNFMLDEDKTSLFCNGYGISYKDLNFLQKILNSYVMDYYLKKTSVQIEGAYQCYQKNFIERFSIPNFTDKEISYLKREKDRKKIDEFVIKKYRML